MTKEEYYKYVEDSAIACLTNCNLGEWAKENPDKEFHDFYHAMEYDGSITSEIDSIFKWTEWREAIEVLTLTDQEPDHVDSGLYEGCNWQKILVVIAYEVFNWDVMQCMEENFERCVEEETYPAAVVPYPTTKHQIGFYPKLQKYKIPKAPYIVEMSDVIKIWFPGKRAGASHAPPQFSVVFEGAVTERTYDYIVNCRRIYNQTESTIGDDFKRCVEEFGVRKMYAET